MTAPGTRTPHPTTVLVVVSAAAFLSSLDLFIVNIAFPAIRADFPGTDLGQMSWILNGYTVVFAAFLALRAGSPTATGTSVCSSSAWRCSRSPRRRARRRPRWARSSRRARCRPSVPRW